MFGLVYARATRDRKLKKQSLEFLEEAVRLDLMSLFGLGLTVDGTGR
jgi:hypothetical protein